MDSHAFHQEQVMLIFVELITTKCLNDLLTINYIYLYHLFISTGCDVITVKDSQFYNLLEGEYIKSPNITCNYRDVFIHKLGTSVLFYTTSNSWTFSP